MRTSVLIVSLFILLLAVPALCATLEGGAIACISEELFDQIVQAAVRKDERGFQYLLEHGCIVVKPGIEVSVLDTTWSGKAKVRAYMGSEAIILWTNVESVKY